MAYLIDTDVMVDVSRRNVAGIDSFIGSYPSALAKNYPLVLS